MIDPNHKIFRVLDPIAEFVLYGIIGYLILSIELPPPPPHVPDELEMQIDAALLDCDRRR
jgi:hypothetical protein